MVLMILGCSIANDASKNSGDFDSGSFVSDTADYLEDGVVAERGDLSEDVRWWKLSANLVLTNDEIELSLLRTLYTADMVLICEQTLTVEQVVQIASPFGGDELWFSTTLGEHNDIECPFSRTEGDLKFGMGPLISDLAVATEMVEWDEEIDQSLFSDVSPMGAYVLDDQEVSIIAYGLSYSMTTELESQWVHIRPIYSFLW
tara:strand:- start:3 stop:608 length:606 start_codon:yes stop_codon:yes gene_type:complete